MMNCDLLSKYRTDKNDKFFTHVAQGETKGKFAFNRQGVEDLFDYCGEKKGYQGMSEMPRDFSMLRCDFDFEKDGTVPVELYEMKTFTETVIPSFRKYLDYEIIKTKNNQTDCCILTKKPYIKKGKTIKHGIHLCFPNVFINKKDFKRFEDKFSHLDGFDSICSKPWLMYNQGKSTEKGMYNASFVLLKDGSSVPHKKYFEKYTIFDDRERKIKFTKPIECYYPRIFSIIPYGREDKCLETRNFDLKTVVTMSGSNYNDVIDCDEFNNEIDELVEQYVKDHMDSCYSIGEWNNEFLQLRRTKAHLCPTTGDREHDALGAYVFGNNSTGKIYIGCFCNEGKAVAIGSFKTVETTETKADNTAFLNKMTQINIDSLINTNSGIVKDGKWVTKDIFDDGQCVVVKAGLGKGKTTASVDHINENNYESIIVLTPRRTFAKSVCNRLTLETKHEFVMYSNLKGKDYIISNPYIVIQVESLNRLDIEKYQNRNTLLLCDEIESILFQMTVCKTHGNKHVENLDMLESLFMSSNKIICLDAFISNRTLNFLKDIKIPYKYYKFTLPLEKRVSMKIDKKKNFLTKLLLDLGMNKKIFLFSSSNKALTMDFLPEIKRKFPNKKVIEYHSKFSSIDLTTINDNWKDADIVACTSTITVGCNFDSPDVFDKIFVYANACSRNLVRDIFQATYRVRHIKDKTMVYCVDSKRYGINLSTYKREIEKYMKMKSGYIVKQYEEHLKMEFPNKKTPDWIRKLVLANIFEQNMSIMEIDKMFQRYLVECSYENEELDEDELEEELDMDEEDSLIDDEIDYTDIPELTFSQMKEFRKKKIEAVLTKLEEAQLEKYYFQHMLVEKNCINQELALWDVYRDHGKMKFRNLSYEKGYKDGSVRICDIVSDIYPEISSRLALRVELIDEICTTLGLTHSQDFSEVTKDKIESCVDWFADNSKRIHNVFDIRDQKKKAAINTRCVTDIINKVFSKWGYSKVKAGKKKGHRVNGKVVYTTPYNIINENEDIDVYQHVKTRKVKQTDRKVKFVSGDSLPM